MTRRQIVGMLACVVLGAGAACGGPKQAKPAPVVQPEAELARGMQLFRKGQFRKAQVVFQRLTFEFSVTQDELAQAHYYVAECNFQLGDYVQAASDFRKVADEFSTTQYAPTALLRAGDSNLRLWHRPELDPSYGETALAIYQELAGRYPDSDAAGRARLHVRRLENQFAEKAYKTGIFYMRRKAFDSAIIYFKDVIANYPNAQRAPDALLRLVDSYRAIGYTQEVQETCEHLRRFYPNASRLQASCPAPPATPT
ncbi:MAG: outer membrane protein assembly factor BamD [Gemmatimonadota bacterium]